MTATRMALLSMVATVGLACKSPGTVPEPGAALVRVTTSASAPQPDELRAWVYDDGGRIWDSVRIPETGALAVTGRADLGTVLIQPGSTARGALRMHVRAFAAGVRVLDGVLSMAEGGRDQKTFDLVLNAAVPVEDDGDDVPDAIDDCLGVPNPLQGGCAAVPTMDASADAEMDATVDAKVDATPDATPDTTVDATVDATTDTTATPDATTPDVAGPDVNTSDAGGPDVTAPDLGAPKATGVTCGNSAECATGFCVDGVCCASGCSNRCHSCNQAGKLGSCQAVPLGTDPAKECGTGMVCNGAEGCMVTPPPLKQLGAGCSAGVECSSGFCADKVCCDTACNGACQNCAGGSCQPVKRMDDVPECSGTRTCNTKGMCV
ncbi:MAG TPA: hypothetical protein VHU40_01215 [Polyangia bacterium]|nr:hypothetical protein [Polyangia bacterium]